MNEVVEVEVAAVTAPVVVPVKHVISRVKTRARKVHWHHHLLRGAILAHVTHYVIVCRSIDADSASDIMCGIFVFTEYLYALRDCTEKKAAEAAEKEVADETKEKVAA